MKKYPHVINRMFYSPLVITHARHAAMWRVLESRLEAGTSDQDPENKGNEVTVKVEAPQAPDWQTFGPDAIIPVHGVLVPKAEDIPMSSCGCGLDNVSRMIDVALADREVKKIVFDFRTPGGDVTGIPELGRKIAGIRGVETIAFTDVECCSGGVWLATQCNHFYTTSSAAVGSIGVWCAYADISRQLANEGVNIQAISAGKYKLLGAYWRTLSNDELTMLQADVDKIYERFQEAVLLHREVKQEFMQGQVYDGEKAVEIGLCDGMVESIDELLFDEE